MKPANWPHNPTCLSCRHFSKDKLRGQFFSNCWKSGVGKPATLRICQAYWPANVPVQLKIGEAA